MNIIDQFKKWFFKEENVGIINIGDILKIPGREYYQNDLSKLNQIDIYKEEYLNILSKRKLISTNQISFDNLEKEFLMHIDLILNLYLNNEEEIIEINPRNLFKKRINTLKLQLYLNEINNMENETIEKLIALEELQKGKRVPIVNRRLLNEKITSLKMILLSFNNQKVAISIEIKNYLMILKDNPINYEDNNPYVIKKYQQIFDIAKQFINENMLYNIGSLNINYHAKIALIEKELEIYVYLHKKDLEAIKKEIAVLKDITKTSANKEQLLNNILEIENKYYIFGEYGRGIITHDNLYELYKLKFNVLTCDINHLEKTPFKFFNSKTEFKCYEEIIAQKFENIILGKNKYINDIYADKANKSIKEIAFYLKGRNNYIRGILEDKLRLALLLAFDKKNGLIEFFNQNMVFINCDSDAFKFTKKIPLDTYLQIIEANETDESFYLNQPLYKLYKLTMSLPQFSVDSDYKTYYMLEGLTKINIPYIELKPKGLHGYINRKIRNNTVIFPSTLEEISGHVFDEKALKIILNRGLKKIGKHAFSNQKTEYLFLPSSVELIEEGALNYKSIKSLYFSDFENSKLLHDKSALQKLIKGLFTVEPISTKPSLEEVHKGIYRESILVGISATLKDINLYNDKGEQILVIKAEKLMLSKKRFRSPNMIKNYPYTYRQTINWDSYEERYCLKLEDIEDIIERLRTIIKEELGYDLKFTEHREKTKKIIKQ